MSLNKKKQTNRNSIDAADLEQLKQAIGQVNVQQMSVDELTQCLSNVSLCIAKNTPDLSVKQRAAAFERQEEEIKTPPAKASSAPGKFDPFAPLTEGVRWRLSNVKELKICFAGKFFQPALKKYLTQADMREILHPKDERNPDLGTELFIPTQLSCTEQSIIVVPDGKMNEIDTAAANKHPAHVVEWSTLLNRLPEQYSKAIQARFNSDQSYKTKSKKAEEQKSHKKSK